MFEDYRERVLAAYQEKKAADKLSPNLMHSTPAKIKAEWIIVFNDQFRKQDEKVLRMFFGAKENENAYMQALRICDADRFRPLNNYLKGITTGPDEKNIELLAWLIDFEPRPYRYGQTIPSAEPAGGKDIKKPINTEEETGKGERPAVSTDEKTKHQPGKNVPAGKTANLKLKSPIVLLLFILITAGGAYLIRDNHSSGCMYWTGNHFQQVPCSQKLKDTLSVALDTARLAHFTMITKPDTMTANSLGKVWYFKNDNKLEFYTAGGAHPVYTDRRLKPLTAYMLNKHVLHH